MIPFVHTSSIAEGRTYEGFTDFSESLASRVRSLAEFCRLVGYAGRQAPSALLAVGIVVLCSLTARAESIQSFEYSQGNVTFLTAPGGGYTYAGGINNEGVIWGQQTLQTGPNTFTNFNFIDTSGTFTQLNVPGASETAVGTINGSGQIVGSFINGNVDGNYMPGQPYLYNGSTFTTLNNPACPPMSCQSAGASGINDQGEIVGTYTNGHNAPSNGFVYSNGIFTTVQAPGAYDTALSGINDQGEMVGNEFTPYSTQGFVDSGGVFTPIDVPGSFDTYAEAINNSGVVVGTYESLDGLYSGFVYSDGTYVTFDLPGATDTYLSGINDQGDLVGYTATVPPVPEPGSLVLFATGLLSIAILRFGRFGAA